MSFTLTKHGEDVIMERGISMQYIEHTLDSPDAIQPDEHDTDLEHRLKAITEHDDRVLRVIIKTTETPVKVVTAYFDRKMRGKL